MTQVEIGADPEDVEAIAAYEEALQAFVFDLNKLHIQFGAPSYSQIVGASVRPKLTKAGLNEVLSGKRLPSREALLEFVRVVSNPVPTPVGTRAGHVANRQLMDHWRDRWGAVKLLQRQVQAPWKRLKNTVKEALEQAVSDAESVRNAAREQADRVRSDALAEADAIRAAAREEAARIVNTAAQRSSGTEIGQVDVAALFRAKWKPFEAAESLVSINTEYDPPPPPFWFSLLDSRPLLPEGGGVEPVAQLSPGTWYLALERQGKGLVAETDDGARGVLHDASGIQRDFVIRDKQGWAALAVGNAPKSLFLRNEERVPRSFWFAVPDSRPLMPEDGSSEPVDQLSPGTWYLALERQGQHLLVETVEGTRGVLRSTLGIQRG
ncbi:hypothetical protein [Streptomyces sp. NBC_00250]|uniref:hypothetical protein n=1 Tax=Streptomyces sp. NBC_00250 TaxID=2903641 RepID=UPI002E2B28B1|nr:hypothetical protein [Streptomyces sp. NBC_00250]